MIKLELTDIHGFEPAIRGMRNAMNSWDKSDSRHEAIYIDGNFEGVEYIIGENDLSLMKKLIAAGSDHRKFMRMIMVWVDITAPFYWWKEFDTYKVGTVANSCSTMHKIHAKELTLDDFSYEHMDDFSIVILETIARNLNANRHKFIESKDKDNWWQMIQLLPTSYNQKRTVMLNYEVLRNMYHARENHKLDEWRTFCKWVEMLPYSELITGKEK
jgi:hypothetical protein